MARIGTIVGFALLLHFSGADALADWSAVKAGQVDSLIQRFLTPRVGLAVAPALSISIGVGGRMVLAKGFGQARTDAPATERTVYHIGSLTKQFTAAAILKLIETVRVRLFRASR